MAACPESVLQALTVRFDGVQPSEFRGQLRAMVPQESMFEVLEFLKQQQCFDMLTDLTCVDYLHYRGEENRFGLVYELTNLDSNHRLRIRVMLNEENLTVPSVVSLWGGANWMEREVWDMFGIQFQGHPDLRRILLPEEFAAHPLRKDYPLQGRGERHNFPVLTRREG